MGRSFFDELIEHLRSVRLCDVPKLVALMEAAGADTVTVRDVARLVLALPEPPRGEGSKLDQVERATVLLALDSCDGNVSAAARLLGIDRKAMERRVRGARRR